MPVSSKTKDRICQEVGAIGLLHNGTHFSDNEARSAESLDPVQTSHFYRVEFNAN